MYLMKLLSGGEQWERWELLLHLEENRSGSGMLITEGQILLDLTVGRNGEPATPG